MKQTISSHSPREWSEAQRRAETYLRALHGEFGSTEQQLLSQAVAAGRQKQSCDALSHPVTLVMESLFALLPSEEAFTITPPIQRTTMLPEKIVFPFHDGLRRLFRIKLLPFAGVR